MLLLPVYRRGLVTLTPSFGQAFGQAVAIAQGCHALVIEGEGHRHGG